MKKVDTTRTDKFKIKALEIMVVVNSYYKHCLSIWTKLYERFGPSGLNYNAVALQNEGVKVLHSVRKELIEGKIALGKIK